MKFKAVTVIAFCAFVSACGGGGSDNDGATPSSIPTVSVASLNATTAINRGDTFDIAITGLGNTVNVSANNSVNQINISGSKNTITFASPAKVNSIKLTGLNNLVNIPKGTKYTVENTGLGNSLVEY
jgi:hypothetical protein